jgi:hypothetical protein
MKWKITLHFFSARRRRGSLQCQMQSAIAAMPRRSQGVMADHVLGTNARITIDDDAKNGCKAPETILSPIGYGGPDRPN